MEKPTPRSLRLRADLTQRQVSDLLDVTQQTVGNWERGVIPRLTPSQAKCLCEAYKCTIEDLIEAFEG